MQPDKSLSRLKGCERCDQKCQFNGLVAGPYAVQSSTLYGCNSILIGKEKRNDMVPHIWLHPSS